MESVSPILRQSIPALSPGLLVLVKTCGQPDTQLSQPMRFAMALPRCPVEKEANALSANVMLRSSSVLTKSMPFLFESSLSIRAMSKTRYASVKSLLKSGSGQVALAAEAFEGSSSPAARVAV